MFAPDAAGPAARLDQLPAQPRLRADLPARRQRRRVDAPHARHAARAHAAPETAGLRRSRAQPAVLDVVHDEPVDGALRRRAAPARRVAVDARLDRRAGRWPGDGAGQLRAGTARPPRPADPQRRDPLPARPVPRLDRRGGPRPACSSIRRSSANAPALPAAQPVAGGPTQSRSAEGGEIEGVRAYRRGDPLKLVAWKKAAQALETGAELVSRDTSTSARRELWLDWSACGHLPAEARLSRLAAWTLAADRADADYGLRLPGVDIAPADGATQRGRCLEALALWGGAGERRPVPPARDSPPRDRSCRRGPAGRACRAKRATRCSCSPSSPGRCCRISRTCRPGPSRSPPWSCCGAAPSP